MTKYENAKQLILTLSLYEIYQYSDSNIYLKIHLKFFEKSCFIATNQSILIKKTLERRIFNSTTSADITDLNIEERITLFQNSLKNEHVYRVPLHYS